MKKIMILMMCWGSALAVFAQDTQPSNASTGTNEIHTIFHQGNGKCKIPFGYFIELDGGYSHFGHKSVFLPGISAGIILNHHFTIGLTADFFNSSEGSHGQHSENDSTSTRHHGSSLNGGYGGLLLEYTLFPQSKIHVSFPLIIGGGMVRHSQRARPGDSTFSQNEWSHNNFSHGEHFFVIEPGVKLELNVVKKLRVGLGISYRYSPERDHLVTSPDLLNQLTGKLTFRFGKF
jgi:hypothetical protein